MKKLILLLAAVLAVLLVVAFLMPAVEKPQSAEIPTTAPTEDVPVTEPETNPTDPISTDPTESAPPTLQENPFQPEDFCYDDVYMSCTAAPYQIGIDVSKYQQNIDWQQVADSGITFVIIRIGGRGYGQAGNFYTDEMAQSHYEGAKAVGLKVGAYFFSQAISVEEAKEEAEYALALTAQWELDMPIVFDWEYVSDTARTANTDAQTVTDCAAAFCDVLLAADKRPMIYVRPELGKVLVEQLAAYEHWIALYSDTMDYPYTFTMWQYTNSGTVPGISGNVDINLYLN